MGVTRPAILLLLHVKTPLLLTPCYIPPVIYKVTLLTNHLSSSEEFEEATRWNGYDIKDLSEI